MDFELQAMTEPGRRFVALAEEHAADFATRAEQHDREGSFPHENMDAMKQSGFTTATVPEEFGGMGVSSIHDYMVAISRLARGDASTAIAVNMHLVGGAVASRLRTGIIAAGGDVAVVEGLLNGMGRAGVIMCGPSTEPGTDVNSPFTEATRTADGWVINGHKIFGTLSPAAQIFVSMVRVREGGSDVRALAIVAKGTPGMEVMDNWDAMGMRASGSHDVVFKDCHVPEASVQLVTAEPWGMATPAGVDFALAANSPLVAAFLGVAEAARDFTVRSTIERKKGRAGKRLAERVPLQLLVAEMEIDIATMRALISAHGRRIDEHFAQYLPGQAPNEVADAMMKDHQCTKYVVNRKAIDVVDRAMTVSGGGAYMSAHPLSRLYRDVRAGPFMQPYAPYEALEYIGKVTLGVDPQIDR
ncbi:MAG: acyl-CoA/acyl-ACP dehydrogenase [Chloroflexota bacterium]|nr:acyl-CoA/acyl-ACP dehydrogenase [Chloroflexota bacterium]